MMLPTLKIALLECDHVRDEFRPIAGDYREMFLALFTPLAPYWQWVFYDVVNGHVPQNFDEADVYFCTGSKFSVYDDEPWIDWLKDFVQQLYRVQKPYVGICFGHQMLGEALGGKVQKADIGWCVGVHGFEWKGEPYYKWNLLMMCQDQIITLPPDTQVLATTPDCRYGMIQVGQTMIGLQAHPEFTKPYEEALMLNRNERIGPEKVERQLKTLTLPLQNIEVAQWIVNFVESSHRVSRRLS
ncbi:MAG: glutamine amidotransferase-related protein [Runella sp.]